MKCDASFSADRRYRFVLTRTWGQGSNVLFVCQNPSTADEVNDDPTVRRCIGFAKHWGYGGMILCNLFAFISRYPKDLLAAEDPVGRGNDLVIKTARRSVPLAVAAWGAKGDWWETRTRKVLNILAPVYCLGRTKSLQPKHPLYLPKTSSLDLLVL